MYKVVACGVPRTGSTLVWQILYRILTGKRVIKKHPGSWDMEPDCFVVGSVRHPYDTAASCLRTRFIGDRGDGSQETVMGTRAGLLAELNMLEHNYAKMKQMMEDAPKRVVVLRYEEFYKDFDVIFNMVETRLGIPVPKPVRSVTRDDCSFRKNVVRSLGVEGKEYQRSKINPGHVGMGTPGTWRAFVPYWGHPLLKKWCNPICEEWGYESQL